MRYVEKSLTLPAGPALKDGKNTHGQTWQDIFGSSALVEPPSPSAAADGPASGENDGLAPARGICNALIASLCIWAGLIWLIWWAVR